MTSSTASTRSAIFGPEPWAKVAGRTWSDWVLWFALVAVLDHEGSLAELEEQLVGELRQHLDARSGSESKLSHLDDLRRRLADAGLVASDLATPETAEDRKVVAKARKKLADR